MHATVKSPYNFPFGVSIGVKLNRPTLGTNPAKIWSKYLRAPGPLNSCLAKFAISMPPTFSRTAFTSRET